MINHYIYNTYINIIYKYIPSYSLVFKWVPFLWFWIVSIGVPINNIHNEQRGNAFLQFGQADDYKYL